MYTLTGILIFILDIIAIVDCIQSSVEGTKKLLWILLILALPFLGMMLYFLLAKRRIV